MKLPSAIEEEIARLGTWRGWAGDAAELPVTGEGRKLVDQAVEIHRGFFSDSWLTEMTKRRRHPFTSMYEWPRTGQPALVRFLVRAMRIAMLTPPVMQRLSEQVRASFQPGDVRHLDVVLEVAGLAARDGWSVEVERQLPSGRLPDLQLTKGSIEYSVEVSCLGTDRNMRRVTGWCDRLHMIMLSVEAANNVAIGGKADDKAVDGCDLDRLERDLVDTAMTVRVSGGLRRVNGVGVVLAVAPREHPDAITGFSGPETLSDPITRLRRRIESKAEQTAGGPPAWIRLDELGGLFQLSPWTQRPIERQLHELCGVLMDTIRGIPHLRGLVLTDGTDPWGAHSKEVTCGRRDHPELSGPVALVRKLPLRQTRRTFILPSDTPRIALPPHLELTPQRWYDEEASWLDWALRAAGWPPLVSCLTGLN